MITGVLVSIGILTDISGKNIKDFQDRVSDFIIMLIRGKGSDCRGPSYKSGDCDDPRRNLFKDCKDFHIILLF
jgi:hypothetical protein